MYFARGVLALIAAITIGGAASAQAAYPDRPVKLIVGFSPGSSTDAAARIVAEGLSRDLGGTFIVENKTGANGMIAARFVAQSKPDGYTLFVSNSSSITVNPLLFKDLGYDPLKDFAPITTIILGPFVLAVNPDNPNMRDVKTVGDLIDKAKEEPDTVTYGSAGIGNLMHLSAAQLAAMSSTEMVHVPYRGAALSEAALLGKEIDFIFDTLSGVPLMKSGKLRALAVSTKERWRDLPDVPTVAEQGYPDFDMSFWSGVFAPSGTPADIVDYLNRAIRKVLQEPEVRQRLSSQGNILPQTTIEFSKQIQQELLDNELLIRRANISLDQ